MRIVPALACLFLLTSALQAQEQPAHSGRLFGILINNRTVADPNAPIEKLSAREKFHLATSDSFDWSSLLVAGYYSGLAQVRNQYPEWGFGVAGFGKRFAAGFADNAVGDYMSEAVFPSLFHADPRYFRMARGSFFHRFKYAVSRIVVTRTDAGASGFNYSEFAGNAAAAGISSLYYPARTRTATDALQKFGTQVAQDAFFNVLKEFWPDVRQRLFHHGSPRGDGPSPP